MTLYTNLSRLNNPNKDIGPVNNAVCSALHPTILASHFSRPGESMKNSWESLILKLQGVGSSGSIRPMSDAIFASDRGNNDKGTIDLINDKLSATDFGTP